MTSILSRPAWAAVLVLSLAGCANAVREQANEKVRQGDYEAAVKELQEGMAKYPDSTTLRAGLLSVRGEAASRLLAQAMQERASGKFDAAEATLQRALALDPRNERVATALSELGADKRAQQAATEANALAGAGKNVQALGRVETALKELPRHPGLQALQRKLEGDLRAASDGQNRRTLAESRPITLDFRNAPLSSVLEALTRGSGVNFILDRDVRQDSRVTVYIRAAKVEDAIDLVTGAHQLARRIIDPQTVLIYPNTPEKQREHQEQVIRVFHLAHADAKSTAALLRSMLRVKEPFVDERANLVALREPAEIIALAERLVALHDIADAEVMLEVEVLEVSTSRLTELGIQFPDQVTLTALPSSGTLTVRSLRDINSSRIGVGVSNLVINLRREVGDVNILANPRIRAKNREKARILIGDKVPVITSTATSTGFVSESVSYLDVGLKLEVEPTVAPDDEVAIKLGLEVSSIAREVRSASGTLAYQLGTRNANTVLRLRDGETQLLAGLISNEDRMTANRVPGLGDLPVAGRLFSSQADDVRRTELVLAITPRVIRQAPRPLQAQAEMWVGTELTTRLRQPSLAVATVAAPASAASAPAAAGPGAAAPSTSSTAAAANAPSSVGASATSAPSLPRLFWQGPAGARVGETFTVTLGMESAAQLRGAPLEIAFPPALLEVQAVLEGDLLKQGGAPTSFTHAVNASAGRINVGLMRNEAEGSAGRGSLVQLRLRAKAPGEATLKLENLRALGLGSPVPASELPAMKLMLR